MPRANAGGVSLYYESAGEGTPLILHGHSLLSWMVFQVPYFSQFYRVIVFDRRGTGRSDDPPGPWTPADLAGDIRQLMDALGIERAIVGGNSLGGVVSSQFGLDYPDRTLALIVGQTVPYLWPLGAAWLAEQIAAAERGEPVVALQPRSYEWDEAGPPTIAAGFETTPVGRYMATLNRELGRPGTIGKALGVLNGWDQRQRYPELQRLDVPALVVVGGNEPQKTIELAHEWSQQFRRGEFVILPNTHHAAAIENPVGWNRAVHGFLRRNGL
jgi:3-oxoadipate enol-lactonase